jgi:hypothetical protein
MLKYLWPVVIAASLAGLPIADPAVGQLQLAASTEKAKKEEAKTKPKRKLTAGQIAARARQKQCGAEWRAAKAAGKIEKGMTWPKFWSACNKRLKAAATKTK